MDPSVTFGLRAIFQRRSCQATAVTYDFVRFMFRDVRVCITYLATIFCASGVETFVVA
jgi:hypothetical protein